MNRNITKQADNLCVEFQTDQPTCDMINHRLLAVAIDSERRSVKVALEYLDGLLSGEGGNVNGEFFSSSSSSSFLSILLCFVWITSDWPIL